MSGCLPFVALWCDESGRLNLLTPEHHLPGLPLPARIAKNSAIEPILPQLAKITPRPQDGRWLLLLESSLPADWLALPWERLTLGGMPLVRQALVVRRAEWGGAAATPQGRALPSHYLDLFPPAEHLFVENLQTAVAAGRLRRVEPRYIGVSSDRIVDLFILAHGDARGLINAQGRPFDLPAMHPMPERIWLLACNIDGAMNRLAASLLERGCRTVIAAVGDLSAPRMEGLIRAWVARADLSIAPAAWLAGQRDERDDGGLQALTVWGALSDDAGEATRWNRLTWEIRHGMRAGLPLDESITIDAFHAALDVMQNAAIWPLTRAEMVAPLLWLAEKHHHPALTELEQCMERQLGESPPPSALLALAASARRLGHYPVMARYLARSLAVADATSATYADCLGRLANLFIDLDLPAAADEVIARHQDLDIADPEARRRAEFKRLDWQARAAARRGRFAVALMHLQAKRQRTIADEKYHGSRELAGLLYLSAWGWQARAVSQTEIESWATEALRQLYSTDPAAIGSGNADEKYLLRALAAWAWAGQDKSLLDQLAAWRLLARDRLAEHDPGPWAYVLVFLHLGGRVGKMDCECALESLVRAGYLLEAALFASLCGHPKAEDWLRRFQQRREKTLRELAPAQGIDAAVVKVRNGEESAVLGRVDAIAESGVLPL